mmetsp:Transcript_97404/g.225805  ORF Transcript_97404/g.225805 Transcript_97404/m.225805 type:complete len:394 (-) Transcript_97404:133-1314(-)
MHPDDFTELGSASLTRQCQPAVFGRCRGAAGFAGYAATCPLLPELGLQPESQFSMQPEIQQEWSQQPHRVFTNPELPVFSPDCWEAPTSPPIGHARTEPELPVMDFDPPRRANRLGQEKLTAKWGVPDPGLDRQSPVGAPPGLKQPTRSRGLAQVSADSEQLRDALAGGPPGGPPAPQFWARPQSSRSPNLSEVLKGFNPNQAEPLSSRVGPLQSELPQRAPHLSEQQPQRYSVQSMHPGRVSTEGDLPRSPSTHLSARPPEQVMSLPELPDPLLMGIPEEAEERLFSEAPEQPSSHSRSAMVVRTEGELPDFMPHPASKADKRVKFEKSITKNGSQPLQPGFQMRMPPGLEVSRRPRTARPVEVPSPLHIPRSRPLLPPGLVTSGNSAPTRD